MTEVRKHPGFEEGVVVREGKTQIEILPVEDWYPDPLGDYFASALANGKPFASLAKHAGHDVGFVYKAGSFKAEVLEEAGISTDRAQRAKEELEDNADFPNLCDALNALLDSIRRD